MWMHRVFYFQHIVGVDLEVENFVQEAYEKTGFVFSFVNIDSFCRFGHFAF